MRVKDFIQFAFIRILIFLLCALIPILGVYIGNKGQLHVASAPFCCLQSASGQHVHPVDICVQHKGTFGSDGFAGGDVAHAGKAIDFGKRYVWWWTQHPSKPLSISLSLTHSHMNIKVIYKIEGKKHISIHMGICTRWECCQDQSNLFVLEVGLMVCDRW